MRGEICTFSTVLYATQHSSHLKLASYTCDVNRNRRLDAMVRRKAGWSPRIDDEVMIDCFLRRLNVTGRLEGQRTKLQNYTLWLIAIFLHDRCIAQICFY